MLAEPSLHYSYSIFPDASYFVNFQYTVHEIIVCKYSFNGCKSLGNRVTEYNHNEFITLQTEVLFNYSSDLCSFANDVCWLIRVIGY